MQYYLLLFSVISWSSKTFTFHAPFTTALAPEFVPNSESHEQVNFKVEEEGS